MTLAGLLDGMKGRTALVVGDVMLDRYIHGRATRVSPEAPVMVIRRHEDRHLPGGAANVAANLAALGLEVHLVGVVGDDVHGRSLAECFEGYAVVPHFVIDPNRPTITKTRVLADHAHQVLRIDDESEEDLDPAVEGQVIDIVASLVDSADTVLCSDYQKGALNASTVAGISDAAKNAGKPRLANVKPNSASSYRGFDLVSVNRAELSAICLSRRVLTDDQAKDAIQSARADIGCLTLMATLGESGVLVADDRSVRHFPARKVEVYDTAGAGDTVIATVAAGWTVEARSDAVFRLAIETSARVVQRVGVAAPSAADLDSIRRLDAEVSSLFD
ncbi:MAG: Bifunctional protein HldE [Fimbriimonadaceae bacterium]|nr:Bifunctional protein HldE [Fimbriimonadaceae bacterium]